MNPEDVPLPLEKTVTINNGVVEVCISAAKMTDKEKKVYKKFMAKCVSASSKEQKEAMAMCSLDFEKMKSQLMEEDDEEEEEEDEREEEC
jgi:hypothetical protein